MRLNVEPEIHILTIYRDLQPTQGKDNHRLWMTLCGSILEVPAYNLLPEHHFYQNVIYEICFGSPYSPEWSNMSAFSSAFKLDSITCTGCILTHFHNQSEM